MPTVANIQHVLLKLAKDETDFASTNATMLEAAARASGKANAKYTLASKSNLHGQR